RLALVLCDLEGRTQPEAARLLGWTPGSLRGRLLRGRARLRERLLRRGVAPAGLPCVLAAGLTPGAGGAAVPPSLAAGVTRSAVRFSSCPTSAGVPPAPGRKLVWAVLLAVGACVAGAGLLGRPAQPPEQLAEGKSPPPAPAGPVGPGQ